MRQNVSSYSHFAGGQVCQHGRSQDEGYLDPRALRHYNMLHPSSKADATNAPQRGTLQKGKKGRANLRPFFIRDCQKSVQLLRIASVVC